MEEKVGKVTHYYNKIGVAVVKLIKSLAVGDRIKISGHDQEYEQEVTSIQKDHLAIQKAEADDEIGLKVDRPVKENDEVYKIMVK